jgi:hypothetical protein
MKKSSKSADFGKKINYFFTKILCMNPIVFGCQVAKFVKEKKG